jgi:hypothetical protein
VDKLKQNWKTSAVGFALAVLYYLGNVGGKLPETKAEIYHLVVGALLAGLGWFAADAGLRIPGTGTAPKALVLLALVPLLAACAVTAALSVLDPAAYAKLMATAQKDVQLAIDLATKAKDPGAPYRLRCYTTLIKYTQPAATQPIVPAAAQGLVSEYEIIAEVDAALQSQTSAPLIPLDVQADCAYVKERILRFAARVGAKVAPIPGGGVLGDFLK